ncbi:MAG: cytidylate kinase-like family protein [Desulfatitalea sp.]|nr:cytidylate kinase-like family protein [Desulfatitalea sp.]NNJ99107.1 cytidylate kinase-like family protein [Desulfatitalea sp.]
MGVITISRGSYSKGKEIAEKLSGILKYECFSRDVLLEASAHFNIPELKLVRAIHDAPSFLEHFGHRSEKYIIYIREAFLEHIQKDNVVYHGLAGQFFIKDIPNVLKVRIVANIEDRVKEEMKREHVSEKEAHRLLSKDDEERRKWSMSLYGIDTKDPSLYDVVLHIDNLKVDDAVDILSGIAKRPCFQTTNESRAMINDAYLAAKAGSIIYGKIPAAEVTCKNSIVYINIDTTLSLEKELTDKVNNLLKDLDEAKEVRVKIIPFETG